MEIKGIYFALKRSVGISHKKAGFVLVAASYSNYIFVFGKHAY